MKLQVEEQKRIVFVTKEELSSKDQECTWLMNEVVSYRIKLEKYQNTNLDDMLRKQRRTNDLTRISVELGQCSSDKKDKSLFEIFKYESKDTNQNAKT